MSADRKILVVDDDPALLPLLVDTLEAIGYAATPAADGVEAMALLREQDEDYFELLVTDVKMPNMDGLTLLKKIRRTYPNLPVLFITGMVSEETMEAASPDGYLSKPFRITQLEELIEKILVAKYSRTPPESPRRVLINVAAEDLRESLSETLSLSNYIPFAVAGGDEALEELERGRFDAMIAGVENTMPQTDPYLDQLRKEHPELPLLLASSTCTDQEIERARVSLKAEGHVSLPFRPGELIALLDKTVRPPVNHSN